MNVRLPSSWTFGTSARGSGTTGGGRVGRWVESHQRRLRVNADMIVGRREQNTPFMYRVHPFESIQFHPSQSSTLATVGSF